MKYEIILTQSITYTSYHLKQYKSTDNFLCLKESKMYVVLIIWESQSNDPI